jgi:hypothetical protein
VLADSDIVFPVGGVLLIVEREIERVVKTEKLAQALAKFSKHVAAWVLVLLAAFLAALLAALHYAPVHRRNS